MMTPISQSPTPSYKIDKDMKPIIQKRQILAMMGIDVWVQRNTPTYNVDYETVTSDNVAHTAFEGIECQGADKLKNQSDVVQGLSSQTSSFQGSSSQTSSIKPSYPNTSDVSQTNTEVSVSAIETSKDDTNVIHKNIDHKNGSTDTNTIESKNLQNAEPNSFGDSHSKTSLANAKGAELATDDLAGNQSTALDERTLVEKTLVSEKFENKSDISENRPYHTVSPFTLIGARFGEWVIMADAQQLKDNQTLVLWQNILQALAIEAETLQFPICEGLDDLESANASVAGFIFRLAKRDHANIAAVTSMPEGIDHNRLSRVPYLSEMLEDGRLKKQFWQLLTQGSS